jgi:hypothetical protein
MTLVIMGSTGNGAKAGLIAGIAYGAIIGVVSYFTLLSIKSTVITSIAKSLPSNTPFTPDQLFNIALIVAPIFVVIAGLVVLSGEPRCRPSGRTGLRSPARILLRKVLQAQRDLRDDLSSRVHSRKSLARFV